jgi:hypothetical protein
MFISLASPSLSLILCAAALSAADLPELPLKVGPTARYLVDQQGHPFFLHGESPWSLIMGVNREDALAYLNDRQAKGVNALIMNLVEHQFNGPVDKYGQGPFLTPGDLSTPNEKYFDHADWVLKQAEQRGMVVLLNPLYLGYKGLNEGWYQEALLNGSFKVREYGRWVGKRYKNYKNIIWVMGGDRKPDQAREMIEYLAAGIRQESSGQLFTAHAEPEMSAMEGYSFAGLDFNATYSYDVVHKRLMREYHYRPTMPYVLFETSYENEHNASPVQIRRQAYWAILSGATGQFYGARPLWLFDPGWKETLQSRGAWDMARVRAFVDAIPWFQLAPDEQHKLVTSGLGEENGMDYLTAAVSTDRRLAAAYASSPRAIEVDLTQLKGESFSGWWYDPQTGASKAAPTLTRGNSKQRLMPPYSGDWVLVMHDASITLPPPHQVRGIE